MIEPGVRRENFRLARPRARWTSQVALVVKNLPANAGDIREVGLIPGWGRSPRRGQGKPISTEWYVGQTTGIVGLIFKLNGIETISKIPHNQCIQAQTTLLCVTTPISKSNALNERFF